MVESRWNIERGFHFYRAGTLHETVRREHPAGWDQYESVYGSGLTGSGFNQFCNRNFSQLHRGWFSRVEGGNTWFWSESSAKWGHRIPWETECGIEGLHRAEGVTEGSEGTRDTNWRDSKGRRLTRRVAGSERRTVTTTEAATENCFRTQQKTVSHNVFNN